MHMQRQPDRTLVSGTHPGAGTRPPNREIRRGSQPQIDFVRIAKRNAWWLIQGLVLGSILGYMYYRRLPPRFRSSAKVQIIESSSKNLPVEDLEGGTQARSLSDEVLVMRSERILIEAAELADLSETPEFSGRTPDQIAGKLAGDESLVIRPALEEGDTNVFQIQYDCTNAQTARRVVQGVVDAYAEHLQNQYRNTGLETIQLIRAARSDVLKKLTELEDNFSAFKKESGLIYRDNSTTNVHLINAESLLEQQQTLMIQHANVSSVLEATRLAIKQNRPTEAVLMGLTLSTYSPELNESREKIESRERENEIRRIQERSQVSASETMRREKLLPLQIERQQIATTVGPDHPALVTIDKRIAVIRDTIDEIAKSEQQLHRQMDSAWSEGDEPTSGNSKAEAENRLRDRLNNGVFALEQKLQSIEEETRIVNEAYIDEMERAKAESARETQSAQYVREISRQQELYDRIMERLDEVNLMSSGAGLKVFPLDTAKPGYQFAPSLTKSVLMGAFAGVMLVAGIALLRDVSDHSYHSALEIAEHIRLPVLGHIPVVDRSQSSDDETEEGPSLDCQLCAELDGKSPNAEAFRAIRTAIFYSNPSLKHQVIQITSATPGDGKSLIASNLAISIAKSGRSVLLMDADLRRPRIDRLFGIKCERGLAWAIEKVDRMPDNGAIPSSIELVYGESIRETVVPNLSVMLSGKRPENPSELLCSSAFDRLMNSLRCKFDMIIIDTPPLLAVSDPSNVVSRTDGIVMVVRLGKNVKPSVARAAGMLQTLDANVLGVVVNGLGSRQAGSYSASTSAAGCQNRDESYTLGYGYSYGSTGDNKYEQYYDDDNDKTSNRRGRKRPITSGPPTR